MQQQQQQQDNGQTLNNNVDELTNRLDRMNVDLSQQQQQQSQNVNSFPSHNNILTSSTGQQQQQSQCLEMSMDDDDEDATNENQYQQRQFHHPIDQQQQQQRQQFNNILINDRDDNNKNSTTTASNKRENNSSATMRSNILLVTNLDSAVFNDKLIRTKFESLFTAYDLNVTFRYLKSFRRVRLDFADSHLAETARLNLNNYKLGASKFRCYAAQIIRPNQNSLRLQQQDEMNYGEDDDGQQEQQFGCQNNSYLSIPKPTKQFLISPPASPPVDWEPVHESSPCIDVRFISALANLVPGKVHELHQGNESQPGIFVEVCEEAQFDNQTTTRCPPRIPKTASPAVARVADAELADDCYQMQM